MDAQKLKYNLKKRFGSAERYYRISGSSRKEMDRAIKEGKITDYWLKASLVDNRVEKTDLTDDLLKQIRDTIYVVYGNQSNFCRKAGFSVTWLSALLHGKHKRKSKKVLKLMKKLKIK